MEKKLATVVTGSWVPANTVARSLSVSRWTGPQFSSPVLRARTVNVRSTDEAWASAAEMSTSKGVTA